MTDDPRAWLTVETATVRTHATVSSQALHDGAVASRPVTTIRVRGEVDLSTLDILVDALEQVGAGAPRPILVDVSAMTFCDATGLATFMEHTARASDRGVDLGMVRLSPRLATLCGRLWGGPQPAHYPTVAAALGVLGIDRPDRRDSSCPV